MIVGQQDERARRGAALSAVDAATVQIPRQRVPMRLPDSRPHRPGQARPAPTPPRPRLHPAPHHAEYLGDRRPAAMEAGRLRRSSRGGGWARGLIWALVLLVVISAGMVTLWRLSPAISSALAPDEPSAAAPAAGAVSSDTGAAPAGESSSTPTTTTPHPRCPSGATLAAVMHEQGPDGLRSGARSVGSVVCAAGFAMAHMASPGQSEVVNAIFAVGPPARFLQAGSGPVCSDDRSDIGAVIVPRFAAAALNCMTHPTGNSDAPGGGAFSVTGYAGEWEALGTYITFASNGRGQVSFRTYNWCTSESPAVPTDPTEPCENPDHLADAGKATVQLERIGSGLVMHTTSSNDRKLWPAGQRQPLQPLRPGVLQVDAPTGTWGLCKPPASDALCGG